MTQMTIILHAYDGQPERYVTDAEAFVSTDTGLRYICRPNQPDEFIDSSQVVTVVAG